MSCFVSMCYAEELPTLLERVRLNPELITSFIYKLEPDTPTRVYKIHITTTALTPQTLRFILPEAWFFVRWHGENLMFKFNLSEGGIYLGEGPEEID